MTLSTLPPARKWVSSWLASTLRPALVALIRGLTMRAGGTFRILMPTSEKRLTLTPEKKAEMYSPTGIK